jgi:large subunit ribosomal protein L24
MAMNKCKIKKEDTVIVISGKDKGTIGPVEAVLRVKSKPNRGLKESFKVRVTGVNVVSRHTRANPSQEKAGGIIKKEAPISVSKIAIYNPLTKKADKLGYRILEDGQKVRIYRSSGEVIGA